MRSQTNKKDHHGWNQRRSLTKGQVELSDSIVSHQTIDRRDEMDVYPLDQHARNLRSLLHPVAVPQEYHEAKRISLQRDEQRLAMSELTLDQSQLDIHMQLMLVRANSLEAIAERATDLQIRISCRERAAEIRQMLEGFEPIVRCSKRHLQELSEVMDL